MDNPLVLIVEDDEPIADFESAVLQSNAYRSITTAKGTEAIALADSLSPDVIILDLGLPDMDGMEVLKVLRQWSLIPVIVVSARCEEQEKVEALDLGADDYIAKPFGTSELLARIRSAMRHALNPEGSAGHIKVSIGDLNIDYARRLVTVSGNEIHLTPIEYKIITLLVKHLGRVLTYNFIINEIWGPMNSNAQVLRVNMANIRRKIEANPGEPKYIITEVGVGYRMLRG